MKITTTKDAPKGFQPVTLTITVESEVELNTLYRLHGQMGVCGSDPKSGAGPVSTVHLNVNGLDTDALRGMNTAFYSSLQKAGAR